eukprot:CAMPEP_0173442726 /NCGR_PEP_ID=MMETSP1357-20121228/28040_1 /TAXON_ID=77926 /ORGANISM="Hemiselmis rufescens, Strain PCC563" /LENGTH=38 /DNA_ID= /DNA_START= /DNA_END= /DNA_ORIENTATION=
MSSHPQWSVPPWVGTSTGPSLHVHQCLAHMPSLPSILK